MKIVRWIVGRIILTLDSLFAPRPVAREPHVQLTKQASLAGLSIYQFEACPFCVKVRRFLKAENVVVPLRDAMKEPFRAELLAGGGKLQVPCLKVESGASVRWLYESSDIIAFLRDRLK